MHSTIIKSTCGKLAALVVCVTTVPSSLCAATETIAAGTVYTNSASYLALGTTIEVPNGAAFDLRTVRNSDYYAYQYTLTIAGTGPDGLGALRDTGTLDPLLGDVQIRSITLSADALIKSSCLMWLVAPSYAGTTLQLNGHTLTIDMADGKNFALCHAGPWNTTGTLRFVNGELRVPVAKSGKNYFNSDLENVTITVEGSRSMLNVAGQAGIFVKNLLMSNSATLVGSGFVAINGGTFKPSETNSAFTGKLRIWGNITIDLSGLNGTWKFPSYDFYICSSSIVTIKPGAWVTNSIGKKKLISWGTLPEAITFKLDSAYSKMWRLKKESDGLYLSKKGFVILVL